MADQDNQSGLLIALAGFGCLAFGDGVIKTMAGQWSPIAIAALRFIIGASVLAILLGVKEGKSAFKPKNLPIQIFRGLCLAMATICFFTAIFFIQLAEATALIFVAPIFTALLSGPLLKERVTPVTWVASLVAFAGVLIVLRPNFSEVGLIALLPLGSAACFSLMIIANRAVAGQGSALSMQVFVAAFAAPILVVCALIGRASGIEVLDFGWPEPIVILKCAFVAGTASTAHWLIYLGTTKAGAATIAPMTYVQLLVAVTLGWMWFEDTPDVTTFAGSVVIISAGLLLWWSGRTKKGVNSD